MELTLERTFKADSYTIGKLSINGEKFCDTLEDKDRGLTKAMTSAQVLREKIKGETAIPTGTYAITMKQWSPKFGQAKYGKQYGFCKGYLPRILGIPGFDGVLIHCGNNAGHTEGCVLVGVNSYKGGLTRSTETFRALYAKLDEADKRKENISITIR